MNVATLQDSNAGVSGEFCKSGTDGTHAGVGDYSLIGSRNKAHTISTMEQCFKGGEVYVETDITFVALEHVA
jgi:hypothetical protein